MLFQEFPQVLHPLIQLDCLSYCSIFAILQPRRGISSFFKPSFFSDGICIVLHKFRIHSMAFPLVRFVYLSGFSRLYYIFPVISIPDLRVCNARTFNSITNGSRAAQIAPCGAEIIPPKGPAKPCTAPSPRWPKLILQTNSQVTYLFVNPSSLPFFICSLIMNVPRL